MSIQSIAEDLIQWEEEGEGSFIIFIVDHKEAEEIKREFSSMYCIIDSGLMPYGEKLLSQLAFTHLS